MRDGYAVVAVNYWSEVKKNIKDVLSLFWKTMLLIHNSEDFREIANFIKKLPDNNKTVFITLRKTSGVSIEYFTELKTKIYYVDCVSSMVFEKENTESCFFEGPPLNLSELETLIDKYLDKFHPNTVIIDSLSHFINFASVSPSDNQKLSNFIAFLKDKKYRTTCKFILIYEEIETNNLKFLPTLDIDLIIRLEVITDKIAWD